MHPEDLERLAELVAERVGPVIAKPRAPRSPAKASAETLDRARAKVRRLMKERGLTKARMQG